MRVRNSKLATLTRNPRRVEGRNGGCLGGCEKWKALGTRENGKGLRSSGPSKTEGLSATHSVLPPVPTSLEAAYPTGVPHRAGTTALSPVHGVKRDLRVRQGKSQSGVKLRSERPSGDCHIGKLQ